jgi:hypothetical protein
LILRSIRCRYGAKEFVYQTTPSGLALVKSHSGFAIEAHAELCARSDHIILAGKRILGVEIGGVEITRINPLLAWLTGDGIDRVRA